MRFFKHIRISSIYSKRRLINTGTNTFSSTVINQTPDQIIHELEGEIGLQRQSKKKLKTVTSRRDEIISLLINENREDEEASNIIAAFDERLRKETALINPHDHTSRVMQEALGYTTRLLETDKGALHDLFDQQTTTIAFFLYGDTKGFLNSFRKGSLDSIKIKLTCKYKENIDQINTSYRKLLSSKDIDKLMENSINFTLMWYHLAIEDKDKDIQVISQLTSLLQKIKNLIIPPNHKNIIKLYNEAVCLLGTINETTDLTSLISKAAPTIKVELEKITMEKPENALDKMIGLTLSVIENIDEKCAYNIIQALKNFANKYNLKAKDEKKWNELIKKSKHYEGDSKMRGHLPGV